MSGVYNYKDLYPNIHSLTFQQFKDHINTSVILIDSRGKERISPTFRSFVRTGLRTLKAIHDLSFYVGRINESIRISADGISYESRVSLPDVSSDQLYWKVEDLRKFRDLARELMEEKMISVSDKSQIKLELDCFFSQIYWKNLRKESSLNFIYYTPLGYNRADIHNMILKLNESRNCYFKLFNSKCLFEDMNIKDYLPENLIDWRSTVKKHPDLNRVYKHNGGLGYSDTVSIIRFLYNFEKHGGDPLKPLSQGGFYESLTHIEKARYNYFPAAVPLVLLEIFYHIVLNKGVANHLRADFVEFLWTGACSPAELSHLDYFV